MKNTARILLLAMLSVFGAMATTVYTQDISSITTVAIPNSSHNIGSNAIAVTVFSGSGCTGSAYSKSLYTYTINGSHEVGLTFNSSTSGCVRLVGPITATSGTNDFLLSGSGPYTVASGATVNGYEARVVNSKTYVATKSWGFTVSYGGGGDGSAYVYMEPYSQQVYVAFSPITGWGIYSSDGVQTLTGSTGFPSDTLHIATLTLVSGAVTAVVDSRNY